MARVNSNFAKNVFINCPFDKGYVPLLRPLVFTILYFDYIPRIATESFDSGEIRINKILKLIKESKYSIHDLSRIQSSKAKEISRFNMPLELGFDIGCRKYKGNEWSRKKCLILESRQFRYQKAISDLSGSDIRKHNNNPENLVRQVRNWFVETVKIKACSSSIIWESFNEFMSDFYAKRKNEGYKSRDLQEMPMPELINFMRRWIRTNRV